VLPYVSFTVSHNFPKLSYHLQLEVKLTLNLDANQETSDVLVTYWKLQPIVRMLSSMHSVMKHSANSLA